MTFSRKVVGANRHPDSGSTAPDRLSARQLSHKHFKMQCSIQRRLRKLCIGRYPVIIGLSRGVLQLSAGLMRINIELMEVLGSAIAKRDLDTDMLNYRVCL